MLRSIVALALALPAIQAWAATDTRHPAAHPDKPGHTAAKPGQPDGKHTGGTHTGGKHAAPTHPVPRAAASAPKPVAPAPVVPEAPAAPAEPPKGSNTGLPLPRFASLKTDEVNLRTGPGLRYPIDWVYKRRDLPVQIEREFEVWRLIADSEGVKGWVHQATLTGRRSFIVAGGEQVVRADPSVTAATVARVKPGVVGRLRACDANAPWCQVQIGDYRGWLKRDEFWGTYPGEAVQ